MIAAGMHHILRRLPIPVFVNFDTSLASISVESCLAALQGWIQEEGWRDYKAHYEKLKFSYLNYNVWCCYNII